MTCRGIECKRLKANKPLNIGRYADGQKRCSTCVIFIKFAGERCPCCKTKLRGKPRQLKYKDKLIASGKKEFGVNMVDPCECTHCGRRYTEPFEKGKHECYDCGELYNCVGHEHDD